ncbi:hypothetical protein V5O48_009088 [Marasmius crinis-equi]|uniref:Acyl-CoA oxidase n=1 Tax=Marasmius crinis-equi TaxID=585013 RepID=A0ABR3FC43_9AGAR
MTLPSSKLIHTPLFRSSADDQLPSEKRLRTAHQRARAISKSYGLTAHDILHCTEKFWKLHFDPLFVTDYSAWTLLVIQLNLAAGIVGYNCVTEGRRELEETLKKIIDFDISAVFMMTELGHGLDAIHLETTATLLSDGTFDLHTPCPEAQKYMPPTLPDVGVPRLGVVMARLKVDSKDCGVRPFLVPLNDGRSMCTGIAARRLPDRPGATPIGHTVTTFDHVILPKGSLLGPLKPHHSPRIQFLSEIWRVSIGSATASALVIPILKLAASIVAIYSAKRTIINAQGIQHPILHFRTQNAPILHAFARAQVLEAFFESIRVHFEGAWTKRTEGLQLRSAYSTIFKATAIRLSRESVTELGDRCGAQGLFAYNQLITGEMTMRGLAIAEGDTLVLSIKLAFELLLNRVTISQPRSQDHPLSLHELSLVQELRALLEMTMASQHQHGGESNYRIWLDPGAHLPRVDSGGTRVAYETTGRRSNPTPEPPQDPSCDQLLDKIASEQGHAHRSEFANARVLPRARSLIEAIGCRMAYEAAFDAGVDPLLLRLFSIGCIERDLGWYVENGVISRHDFYKEESAVISQLLPTLNALVEECGMKPYITARICDGNGWKGFAEGLGPELEYTAAPVRARL